MTLAPLPPTTYQICDDAGTVLLDLNDGNVITTGFDPGSPDAREVTVDRTRGDGQIDTTQYHGARAVAWSGQYMGSHADLLRFHARLRALCHPGNRFYFYFTGPDFEPRRVLLRSDTTSTPWSNQQEVTAAWRGIDGVLEDVSLYRYTFTVDGTADLGVAPLIIPFIIGPNAIISGGSTSGAAEGRVYPYSYPYSYIGNVAAGAPTSGGSTSGTGSLVVTNLGTTAAPPVFRIYGPCSGPQMICVTTGARMSWPDVTIPEGTYLLVDCGKKKSYFGEDPSRSPIGFDFSVSDWPLVPASPLEPLTSRWQLLAASSSPGWGAQMDVRFRWL